MDFLTKWPEVFAVPDQTAATIAKLLVEEIVSRHGVPSEILSDRGRAFMSGLMKEVESLLGFHKVNTTAYHPQSDGLVERFNRTLIAMLAKSSKEGGKDWDQHLPYILFAYRVSQQDSTRESPFFLLYGRDPRLPTPAALCPSLVRDDVNLREHGVELATRMSAAWEEARKNVKNAQKKQKKYYDRRAQDSLLTVGDRVFLKKFSEKNNKLARMFHGPYWVVEISLNNTAQIRRVDKPQEEPILVAMDRLRRCPEEVGDNFWPDKNPQKRGRPRKTTLLKTEKSIQSPEDG